MKSWKVVHRGGNGSPVEEWLEAESRDELFAALRQRGIRAIRIEESRRGKATTRRRGTRGLLQKVLLRGAVAVAVVALVFLVARCILLEEERIAETPKDEKSLIVEVPPSLPTNTAVASQPEKSPPPRYKTKEEQYYAETNGLSKAMMAKWRFEHRQPAAWTNDSSKIEQPEYATFDFQSEKEIICLLTVEPGDVLLGVGNYGPGFERDFLKSLTQPIVISKDDTPERAEWKKMMIAAKIELKARMDAGESISEIMSATRREYQRLAEMKEFIKDEIRSMRDSKGVTVKDMETCIEAANKMLESKGVSKLKISPLMRKALMRKCIDYRPDALERN